MSRDIPRCKGKSRKSIPRKSKKAKPPSCPYCHDKAELVTGKEIYEMRADLWVKKFWRCKPCRAHVGCHPRNTRRGRDGTQPLGPLANAKLRRLRHEMHVLLDPMWQEGSLSRIEAYEWLADQMEIPRRECHAGHFTMQQCVQAIGIMKGLK